MTHLLQDKRIVSILAVAAVLVVGWRFQGLRERWLPPVPVAALEAAVSPFQALPDSQAVLAAPGPGPRESVLNNLTHWERLIGDSTFTRDPFGPLIASADPGPASRIGAGLPGDDLLVLSAVSIEPLKAFAVINRQILAVGEPIGTYQVERIRSHEVWLQHPTGRRVLRLGFSSPLPSAPVSNKPAPQ
jgi:hypothetical protein